MVCLKIKSTKDFMQKFLMAEAFADFLLIEAKIDTFVSYAIDGHVRRDFYTREEQAVQNFSEYASWESVRPLMVQLIKGKRTPLAMKYVLAYEPAKARARLEEDAQAAGSESVVRYLLCTVKFESGVLTLTGGVSYQGFNMDKSPEKCWDRALCGLMEAMGLEYEII